MILRRARSRSTFLIFLFLSLSLPSCCIPIPTLFTSLETLLAWYFRRQYGFAFHFRADLSYRLHRVRRNQSAARQDKLVFFDASSKNECFEQRLIMEGVHMTLFGWQGKVRWVSLFEVKFVVTGHRAARTESTSTVLSVLISI